MNPVILGVTLVYVVPFLLGLVFWLGPVKRLIGLWTGRDVMSLFRPERRHVAHTERLLGVRRMVSGPRKTTWEDLLAQAAEHPARPFWGTTPDGDQP